MLAKVLAGLAGMTVLIGTSALDGCGSSGPAAPRIVNFTGRVVREPQCPEVQTTGPSQCAIRR